MTRRRWFWWVLAALWSLLLVQALAYELFEPEGESEPSWAAGALIWLPVFVGLVAMGRRRR